jgi:hypothetical protein
VVQGIPWVYEVFRGDDNREFFERILGTYLPFQHEVGAHSFFSQSLTLLDILEHESVDQETCIHSGYTLILGMTALDLLSRYPVPRSEFKSSVEPNRTVLFCLAYRTGNDVFSVRVLGSSVDTLGLYLKATLLVAADYDASSVGRGPALEALMNT